MCEVTVLVVEDNERDLREICKALSKAGVTRLLCINTGEDAMAYLDVDDTIDLLICSEELPGITGSSLISKVRDKYKSILGILCMSKVEPISGLRAKSCGAQDLVRKTPSFEDNLNTIIPPIIQRLEIYHKVIGYG